MTGIGEVVPGGRKAQILAAARELVAEGGMVGITVRGVAARAGIGASTLRHYFPSQADLYSAVSQDLFSSQITEEYINDTTSSPRQRLLCSLRQFVAPQAGVSLHEFARVLVRTYAGVVAASESGHEQPGKILGDAYAWSHETVARWLQILADEGRLRPIDVSVAAIAAMALLNGLIWDLAVGGIQPGDLDRVLEALVDLLVEE